MKKFLLICLCVIVGAFALGGVSCGDGNSSTNNRDSGWTDWH